jgi:hypothetical protein
MVGQPYGWPAPSTNREHTRRETPFFIYSSAILGCLGVLGDSLCHWLFGALNPCAAKTQEGIIAEDAEDPRIAEKRY